MTKKVSLFVGLCIALSSLFTACNKSEDKVETTTPQAKTISFKEMNPNFVSTKNKGMIITDNGEVTDRYGHTYQTLIIGKQEWLLQDLYGTKTLFSNKVIYPNDVATVANAGQNHGLFYRWANVIDGTTQTNWDYLFTSGTTIASGFHVPTPEEVTTLATNLGSSENIVDYLELGADGYYNATQWCEPNTQCFWVNANYNSNRVAGCGVFLQMTNNTLWYNYTNIPNLVANVRLVRTIQ